MAYIHNSEKRNTQRDKNYEKMNSRKWLQVLEGKYFWRQWNLMPDCWKGMIYCESQCWGEQNVKISKTT